MYEPRVGVGLGNGILGIQAIFLMVRKFGLIIQKRPKKEHSLKINLEKKRSGASTV
jgi:hypothetical protein